MSEKIDPVPIVGNVTREQVREMFPEVTAFADAIRVEFGDGVKLVYAEENGRCIGERSVTDPERTVKLSEIELDPRPRAEIATGRKKEKRRAK